MVGDGDVALSWHGLPQFAARLFRAAIEAVGKDCIVVGSRPEVPVEGMERALGQPIYWVDASKPTSWRALGLEVPQIFFQHGWRYPAFSALGAEVKRAGGHVIGMSDANWRGELRQLLVGATAFRLLYRRHFDAMLVPGCQGQRLMHWFGMPPDRVRCGLLGADSALFDAGLPLSERPTTFLFVGQFIARKDVLSLAAAFLRIAHHHPKWRLSIIGGGEQRDLIPTHPQVSIEEFIQPEQLADRFRRSRFFVLPSLREAWGMVVHEAALSGCGLILSDRIGSAEDLGTPVNCLRFRAGNVADLARTLDAAAQLDAPRLAAVEAESRRLAGQFGPARFGAEVVSLVQRYRSEEDPACSIVPISGSSDNGKRSANQSH